MSSVRGSGLWRRHIYGWALRGLGMRWEGGSGSGFAELFEDQFDQGGDGLVTEVDAGDRNPGRRRGSKVGIWQACSYGPD